MSLEEVSDPVWENDGLESQDLGFSPNRELLVTPSFTELHRLHLQNGENSHFFAENSRVKWTVGVEMPGPATDRQYEAAAGWAGIQVSCIRI